MASSRWSFVDVHISASSSHAALCTRRLQMQGEGRMLAFAVRDFARRLSNTPGEGRRTGWEESPLSAMVNNCPKAVSLPCECLASSIAWITSAENER